MTILIFFALLSILFSFMCSIWEAVLLSITPAYVSAKVQEGGAIGTLLKEYKKDIDRPLSAILTLNTVAHTVGAIGVGAQAGALFGSKSYMGISYESIVAALMTLAILILSEIIPKTIGANMWKSLAPFTVKSIRILLWILAPLVWLSQLITKKLKKDKNKSVLSRSDFSALAAAGEESGAIVKSESRIIKNLIKLKELNVFDIMTPRTVIHIADENQSVEDFYNKNQPIRYSRIPVYSEKADDINGLVLKDVILEELALGRKSTSLKDLKMPMSLVNSTMSLQALFDHLVGQKRHIAAVVDDYGSLVGLVTMEDLLETILGLEITDETDTVEDLQSLAKKRFAEKTAQL